MLKGSGINSVYRNLRERFGDRLLGFFLGLIICMFVGAFVATTYLHGKDVRNFRMWQEWYGPAVGFACGYGYTSLPAEPNGPLERFLDAKTDTFDCAKALVPDNYQVAIGNSDCKYLIGLVGLFWRITGPSWHSVKLVIGMLYVLMAVAAFLLARSLINTPFSVGVTLLFITAPANMDLMTRLRDLGKAPFILLACAGLIWMIGSHFRKWLGLAALTGLIIGIGFGFRPDILAILPISILLLVFVAPREINWYRRLAATTALLLGFFLSASPILFSRTAVGNNNLPHVTILGLSHLSDYNLGVQPGNYSWGINQADNAVLEAMNAYAALKFPHFKQVLIARPEYEVVGMSYLLEMLRTFPADMVLRVEAATASLTDESVMDVFRLSNSEAVEGIWLVGLVWFSIAGIFCIGFRYPRRAVGFGLVFTYLIAVAALQFEHRHHFYMEVFVLISLAAVLNFLVTSRLRPSKKSILIALGGSASLLASVLTIQTTLQFAESFSIGSRLKIFIASPRETLTPAIQRKIISYVTFPELQGRNAGDPPLQPTVPQPAYPLVMTIDQSRCGSTWRYFRVDYGVLKHLDYTFWLQPYPRAQFGIWSEEYVLSNISALGDKIQITVPLYRDGTALREIQLSPGMANCVVKWERLHSNDAIFDLMNWVIDKTGNLIPFKIELSKPRP